MLSVMRLEIQTKMQNEKFEARQFPHTDENSKTLIRRDTPAVANNSSSRSNSMLQREIKDSFSINISHT